VVSRRRRESVQAVESSGEPETIPTIGGWAVGQSAPKPVLHTTLSDGYCLRKISQARRMTAIQSKNETSVRFIKAQSKSKIYHFSRIRPELLNFGCLGYVLFQGLVILHTKSIKR
jgi:hypothetical protein